MGTALSSDYHLHFTTNGYHGNRDAWTAEPKTRIYVCIDRVWRLVQCRLGWHIRRIIEPLHSAEHGCHRLAHPERDDQQYMHAY